MAKGRKTGPGVLKGVIAAEALLRAVTATANPVERWDSQIASASERFGIPESWIRRVMRVESGGEPLFHGQPIVSPAGAIGLMQLMPRTWRDMRAWLGLGQDPHDPGDNILAGAAYLRLMYDRFGYPGLFAAYNAGPARYAAYRSGRRMLPAETRSYVAAIARPVPLRSVAGARPAQGIFANPRWVPGAAVGRTVPRPHDNLFVLLGSAPMP